MRTTQRLFTIFFALGLLAAGCSTDSPKSPTAPPASSVPPPASITVTVTTDRTALTAGTAESALITVRAVFSSSGQPVPNLTQATVTTTLGEFGAQESGDQEVTLELVNGQAQVVLFPGTAIGTATVRAQVSSAVGFASISIREEAPAAEFFISSVSPSTGSPQGGDTVTIFGGAFASPLRVLFGGVPATILSSSSSQIQVSTPALAGGLPQGQTQAITVSVTIRYNTEEEQTDSLSSGFTYTHGGVVIPTIVSVTPASGPNEGGTQVTINGSGFDQPVQVKFGQGSTSADFDGIEAQVTSVSSTQLIVISPTAFPVSGGNPQPQVNSLADILVKNLDSGLEGVSSNAFRYTEDMLITSISPAQGPHTGGTTVTIFGHGFDEPVAVSMAGVGQQVISVTGSEVVVRTVAVEIENCSEVSGPTIVTNIENADSATGPTWLYDVDPVFIFSLNDTSGPQAGGDDVTISGQNFSSPVSVIFTHSDSFSAGIQSVTSSAITVLTPAIPNSELEVEACDDNDDGTEGEKFIATTFDITVTNLETECEATFENAYTYTPTNTTCRNDEAGTLPQCSNGVDDDGDTLVDFPNDPQCANADDNNEAM